MPTRKTIFWFMTALVTYLIAWNIGSGWLYILTSMLISFPLVSLVLARINTSGLAIHLSSDHDAETGGSISSRLNITNRSRLSRYFLSLDCQHGGSRSKVFVPAAGGRADTGIAVDFHNLMRGVYPGAELTLKSSAPLGLAKRRRRFSADCPLVVYPYWYRLAGDWDTGLRNAGNMASSALPTRNSASDYLGVRDYRPEDSPRSIHWRTTARSNQLAVIEYAQQTIMAPVMIVDPYCGGRPGGGAPFEAAVTAAASLVMREGVKNRRFGFGHSLSDAAGRGLSHDTGPAMRWLAGISAGAESPLNLDDGLPWPEVTPVLLLTSFTAYADIDRSQLFDIQPHALVIMINGRLHADGEKNNQLFMDDARLMSLADRLDALGGRMVSINHPNELVPCLESL